MSLTVSAAPGFATNFSARRFAPQIQLPHAFFEVPLPAQHIQFFGICLLTAENTGTAPIQMLSAAIDAAGEFSVYGPIQAFTLPPAEKIPIGIAFHRYSNNTNTANAMLRIKLRESGIISTVEVGLVVTINPLALALFVPSVFEFVASPVRSKSQMILLECQQQVNSFTSLALPSSSAFADTLPVGSFTSLAVPVMTVSFNSDPNKNDATQVLTITATGPAGTSSVPIICWTAETVLPGELAINITRMAVDPPGSDLPGEFITISNVSARALDLTGCTLQDEGGGIGNTTFYFPPGFALLAGASVNVHTRSGINTGTDLFMNRLHPVWDNDFDTALIRNFVGDPVASYAYFFGPPGAGILSHRLIDAMIPVDQAFRSTFTGLILEDGDVVILQPDRNSRSFAGNLAFGATDPDGVPGTAAPDDNTGWPLPGAPLFALLAEAGTITLLGTTPLAQVVNRTSTLRPNNPLNLLINDSDPGGAFAWGAYWVRVQVFRN